MKHRLFVGSSTESLDVAYAIQESLDRSCEVTVWSQGVFEPSRYSMDALVDVLDGIDFGVFVFAPDDIVRIRGAESVAARDNVVFELGLFIGRLGRERSFIIIPSGHEDFHIPTDLLGLTPATYDPNRVDRNLVAALGPACNRIRKVMERLGPIKATVPDAGGGEEVSRGADLDDNDILSLLESWFGKQPLPTPIRFSDADRELGLPPGSAEKYLEVAAKKWNLKPKRRGKRTIVF